MCKKYSAKRRRIMAAGEKINHLEIFERDNWTCGICHKPINKYLRQPNWYCASIDHIHPISAGGKHVRENIQASHYICNLKKGDRLATDDELVYT